MNPAAANLPPTPAATPPDSPPVEPSAVPVRVPPMFRAVDWLTFLGVVFIVFVGYYLTIAPDVTLEDSGELATGSFYAGIPHPPGYPVWVMYTWVWTVLLPFGSVAWRVAMGEGFAGAVASGLLAMIVSRGSSMLIESIEQFKDFERKWENAICVVSGGVAGLLLGFNGFMWSQSVIVEVYSFSLVSLMGVLIALMRWTYAPQQWRYLYLAFFLHGICTNNHQSLLVAAMGMEIAALAVNRKLACEMFFWNTVVWLAGLALIPMENPMVKLIYNSIGLISAGLWVGLWIWMFIREKMRPIELGRDVTIVLALGCIGLFLAAVTHYKTTFGDSAGALAFLAFLALAACGLCGFLILKTRTLSREWLATLLSAGAWIFGASFYLYMAISGMTNPPMEWGYPRTVEGFFHALSRGQYDRIHPTTGSGTGVFEQISSFLVTFAKQMWMYYDGMNDEFSLVYLLIPVVLILFYRQMQKRERAWMISIAGIYLFLGPFLVWLLNPGLDRASKDLNKVFFTASHTLIAIAVGYGMTLIAATLATSYKRSRTIAILGTLIAVDMAVYTFAVDMHTLFGNFGGDAPVYAMLRVVFAALALACLALIILRLFISTGSVVTQIVLIGGLSLTCLFCLFTTKPDFLNTDTGIDTNTAVGFAKIMAWLMATGSVYMGCRREDQGTRRFLLGIGCFLGVISVALTVMAILANTFNPSNLGLFFSSIVRSFRPDQYALPVIADLIVIGITVAFLAGLLLRRTRAPLALILVLFCGMPAFSVLSHWFENEQRDHWFGYWFGHDMFTPPFTAPDGTLSYDAKLRAQLMEDPKKGRLIYPEMTRNAVLYGGTDPGRFCPTYMIFCESFVPPRCKPMDPAYDRRDVYIITQNALADGTYLDYIRAQYNRSTQIDPPFFQELLRGPAEQTNDIGTNLIARLADEVLDKPLTEFGAKVEARRRKEGVFPPKEIYIASPDDLQRSYAEYIEDAARRRELGQLKPGEDVTSDASGRVAVNGQVAVFAINGLLTKVMFDHNPGNEFFVEESFPLDWMYPYETPFGIIMKINRQPLPSLSSDILERDHEFWVKYSERLIGNWIDDRTPIKDIVDFVEKVYQRKDFSTFKGDRKFIRDDDAQKAFSKLRSSIGGIYAWRLNPGTPAEFRPKTAAEYEQLKKECDFAFRQSFAFCPYSPEAVFRYVNFLLQFNRLDDAILVAQTCLEVDPNSAAAADLVKRLNDFKKKAPEMDKARITLQQLEDEVRDQPTNYQAAFNLAGAYIQMQQVERADEVLDHMLADPHVPMGAVVAIAQRYAQLKDWARVERALETMSRIAPDQPEVWYDLAGFKCDIGKNDECLKCLARAIELSNARLAKKPNQRDLAAAARTDQRFEPVRNLPEFKKLVGQ